jgi:peptide subunit release factor 1 (eRF1)
MNQETPRRVAIWIDHREAILATFVGNHIKAEGHISSDAGPHTHGGGWSQRRIEAHRYEMLKHFYEEVVHHLGPVDEILILGPGQAKLELRKHIEHHKGLKGRVRALANAPHLTEAELITQAETLFNSEEMSEAGEASTD